MATSKPRTTGGNAGRDDDDEAQDNLRSPRDFFRGEWRWLWPVWLLALLMLLVILVDRFVAF
jgi:hypothetical protein